MNMNTPPLLARVTQREPLVSIAVALAAVLTAALTAAATFGVLVTPNQAQALIVLVNAVLGLFTVLARRLVTPVADPRLDDGRPAVLVEKPIQRGAGE